MKFLKNVLMAFETIVAVGAFLSVALLALWFILWAIVEPLAPLVTFGLVVLGTVSSFQHRSTAILAMGGIGLYLASWQAVTMYGPIAGAGICSLGILLWMSGVFNLFPCLRRDQILVPR
ncbi:MAG: hypothetical protein QY311_03225 [Candidatus Paceibacterota bacterium]|nr:MAG: hypothetical protein QY311_03225 [Candidatus Paceibacterota bacterium]